MSRFVVSPCFTEGGLLRVTQLSDTEFPSTPLFCFRIPAGRVGFVALHASSEGRIETLAHAEAEPLNPVRQCSLRATVGDFVSSLEKLPNLVSSAGVKPPSETASRGPPEPYIVDGQPYYNVQQASRIIGTITTALLWNWCKCACTPFGFELSIKQLPMTVHRRSTQAPKTYRQYRMLIPAAEVEALKQIMSFRVPPYRGRISPTEMDTMRFVARRFRSPSL